MLNQKDEILTTQCQCCGQSRTLTSSEVIKDFSNYETPKPLIKNCGNGFLCRSKARKWMVGLAPTGLTLRCFIKTLPIFSRNLHY